MKSLATGVAAVAAIGGAAAGVSSVASVTPAAAQVQPVVFSVPLPLDPAVGVPTADELSGLLNALQNPGVPFASKGYLVEGGVGGVESRIADRKLQKAAQTGQLPLSFNVANIAPAGPGVATADVTASGPALPPTTQNVMFVNQGSWKLSRASAMSLISQVS